MGTHYGPVGAIVTSGLILNLDAANPLSYPGTGDTWFDLSSSKANLKFTSTGQNSPLGGPAAEPYRLPTYSTNGFFTVNNSEGLAPVPSVADNFTYEVWAKPTSTHQIDGQSSVTTQGLFFQKSLIVPSFSAAPNCGSGVSCGTNGISIYEHSGNLLAPVLVWSGTVSSTNFSQILVTYTNKQPAIYLNNTLVATGSVSPRTSVFSSNAITAYAYDYFSGDVAVVRIYNKSLSQFERMQSFNAIRRRYGL